MNARTIQVIALGVVVTCASVCGALLPPIRRQTEEAGLRYTDVSVEGAPPFVAIGTWIGALRGLIVDYLWIKVNFMKEKGLFYEVMADSDLITKLQPRFAAVWAFHGHNMAYNISVASHTQEERWEWVNAGIRLVRNEGLRYNPNDLELHKELAFWFGHKIEGYSDDAHLFYKREFCHEWHFLLGPPPEEHEARIAWIREVADAPLTVEAAERRTPGVRALIARLTESLSPFDEQQQFNVGRNFLRTYGLWQAVSEQSEAARLLGVDAQVRAESPFFNAFDGIATDPALAGPLKTLVLLIRKRVLLDEYNMNPQLMYEYTRDLGPIDWRNAYSHQLYWARRGSQLGESRVMNDDDIYKVINNDRLQIQAMQALARYGRITYDPFSTQMPSRFPEPRWVDVIEGLFEHFYSKHYETRGAGGETFIEFLKNFLGSAIREAYRSGERERAERLLQRLDYRFGSGAQPPNPIYQVPVEVFVREEIKGEYSFQPHLAPSEAIASLRYGFREGVGRDRPDVYKEAKNFVRMVIDYFRGNESNDYVNRFGERRMGELLQELEVTQQRAFLQLMTDSGLSMRERATIWGKVDKHEPMLRLEIYDLMAPSLEQQFARHELSHAFAFQELFPPPPGLEQYRAKLLAERKRMEEEAQKQKERDEIQRKGE